MRGHAAAIEKAGWRKPVDTSANGCDAASPFRVGLDPFSDPVACFLAKQAASARNDERVQRQVIVRGKFRAKDNSRISRKLIRTASNNYRLITGGFLPVLARNITVRECLERSDEIDRRNPIVSKNSYSPSFHYRTVAIA